MNSTVPTRVPYTLWLPPWLTERFDLARLLSSDPTRSWSQGYELLAQFELRTQEQAFAKDLLKAKPNLRLYRANQRLSCGDFIVVDMSAPDSTQRRILFIELKMGEPVRPIDSNHHQLRNWKQAQDEIAAANVVAPSSAADFVIGGEAAILERLGGGRV